MQRFFYALLFLSLCFTSGCGGSTVKVHGTVKMKDGTPVETGTVILRNNKAQFSGEIHHGKFSPGRVKDGDGIFPGVYDIIVVPSPEDLLAASANLTAANPAAAKPDAAPSGDLFHPKYRDPTTSGLTIDTSQTRTLEIVLDPPEDH